MASIVCNLLPPIALTQLNYGSYCHDALYKCKSDAQISCKIASRSADISGHIRALNDIQAYAASRRSQRSRMLLHPRPRTVSVRSTFGSASTHSGTAVSSLKPCVLMADSSLTAEKLLNLAKEKFPFSSLNLDEASRSALKLSSRFQSSAEGAAESLQANVRLPKPEEALSALEYLYSSFAEKAQSFLQAAELHPGQGTNSFLFYAVLGLLLFGLARQPRQ
eukprot:jgi/Mesen1/5558/ME000280S04681